MIDCKRCREGMSIPSHLEDTDYCNECAQELLEEFLLAVPECCWRKCWNCGKVQIHISPVYPYVLCRSCGSQDTRLMKKETQALKGEPL